MNDIVGTFEIDIRGRKVAITVTNGGQFKAEIGEKRFSSESLEGLRTALMAHTKRITVKVAVPATYITSGGSYGSPLVAKPVTLTGIHAKDGDVLFRYDDTGQADRASSGGMHGSFMKPLSSAERALFNEKSKAKYDANKDYDEFVKRHQFSALKAVEEAIEKVNDEAVGV